MIVILNKKTHHNIFGVFFCWIFLRSSSHQCRSSLPFLSSHLMIEKVKGNHLTYSLKYFLHSHNYWLSHTTKIIFITFDALTSIWLTYKNHPTYQLKRFIHSQNYRLHQTRKIVFITSFNSLTFMTA